MATTFETNEFVEPELVDDSLRPDTNCYRDLIAIATVVALADLTVYRGQGYMGLAEFVLGAPLAFLFAKPRSPQGASFIAIAVLLLVLAARLVWYGSPGQVAAGIVLVVAFATVLERQPPFVLVVFAMASQTVVGGARAFASYFVTLRRTSPVLHSRASLNVVLPMAAFLIFSTLFVLANPDAINFLSDQIRRFIEAASEWFIRAALRPTEPLFWIAIAWITAGLLRPILPSFAIGEVRETVAKVKESSMFSAYRNTLLTVIVLFACYLTYEFLTLWTRDFPKGFYYAGYAHEGAAWLTVALALATAILSVVFSGSARRDPRLPHLQRLAWIWSIQNLLLSLAVYNRLFIYIDFNGMTRMRIVGLFGISLVVVGFLLVVWKIARTKGFIWLIQRQMWALALAIYLLLITPVDGIAVSYNVRQIQAGNISAAMQIGVQPIDVEGILCALPLLDSSTPEIRDGVAALVARQAALTQIHYDARTNRGWTAYQASDRFALDRFESVRGKWNRYANDLDARDAAIKRFYDFSYQWY